MFAIAAHAGEREAHAREVERSGADWPDGSYGRRNRQAIAARETRVAARLRAVQHACRAAAGHDTAYMPPEPTRALRTAELQPGRQPAWRPSRDPRHRGQQRRTRPGRTGHAAASWPTRPTPLQSRTMAHDRPRPGQTSRRVIDRADQPHPPAADSGPAGSPGPAHARGTAGTAPWPPLCRAPGNGADVTRLARMTRRPRTRPDRHRRQPAGAGGPTGDSRGRWRVPRVRRSRRRSG